MCEVKHDEGSNERAAIALAQLVERKVVVDGRVDPVALRLFICADWDRVCILAHTIHGGPLGGAADNMANYAAQSQVPMTP